MLGLSLHSWEDIMIFALAIVGVFGVIVGIATWAVVRLQRIELAKAEQEFQGYKLETSKEISEANARALEAQLALEKLKAPRLLTEEQLSRISEKLEKFKGTKFDAAVIPSDPEAIIFLSHITAILEKAGWIWVDWEPAGHLGMTYSYAGKPKIGQFGFFGVALQINPAHAAALSAPANVLGSVLTSEGFEATLDVQDNVSVPNRDSVHIIVGKKRQ